MSEKGQARNCVSGDIFFPLENSGPIMRFFWILAFLSKYPYVAYMDFDQSRERKSDCSLFEGVHAGFKSLNLRSEN